MSKKTLNIETVHQCNCHSGSKTLHPLISVIDLSKVNWTDNPVKFNFYTILFIENECNDFRYGRKYYDYSDATMIFLPPGQSIQIDGNNPLSRNGRLLAFHPHLISGTTLGINIGSYTFFSYQANEALHLSLREKAKIIESLENIGKELQHTIDSHSQILLSRHIELLLDYCCRFYERQLITRNDINKQILDKMERLLDEHIQSGKLKSYDLPTTQYCAEKLNLSPQYFNDLLKFETGKTIDVYFRFKRIQTARKMLLDKDARICQVAEELGFPDARYFSKLFRQITGVAPEEYRLTQN